MKAMILCLLAMITSAYSSSNYVNARNYDTSADGILNVTEMRTAIAATEVGGVLYLPSDLEYSFFESNLDGYFTLSSPITLLGDNNGLTELKYDDSKSYNYRMFRVQSDNVCFQNIIFNGMSKQSISTDMLKIESNSDNITITNCVFKNLAGGTWASNPRTQQYAILISGINVSDYSINNCRFENISQKDILGNGKTILGGLAGGVLISSVEVFDPSVHIESNGIITNCTFKDIYTIGGTYDADGIRFNVPHFSEATNFKTTISNNTFVNVEKSAVKAASVKGVTISHNKISSSLSEKIDNPMFAAIRVQGDARNVTISHNTAEGYIKNGLILAGDDIAVNKFSLESTYGGGAQNAIQLGVSRTDMGGTTNQPALNVSINGVTINKCYIGIYCYNSDTVNISDIKIKENTLYGVRVLPRCNNINVDRLHIDRGALASIKGYEVITNSNNETFILTGGVENISINNSFSTYHYNRKNGYYSADLRIYSAKNLIFNNDTIISNSNQVLSVGQYDTSAHLCQNIVFNNTVFNRAAFNNDIYTNKSIVSIASGNINNKPENIQFNSCKFESVGLQSSSSAGPGYSTLFFAQADDIIINNSIFKYGTSSSDYLDNFLYSYNDNLVINNLDFNHTLSYQPALRINGKTLYSYSTPFRY